MANLGRAIPPAERETLFVPFLAARGAQAGGAADTTGLGLAFCKLAIEAHGGSIRVVSPWPPHAEGVQVILTLPAAAALP